MRLEGKTAIITGASSGIGEGIARRFLQEGAQVFGCGIEAKMRLEHPQADYLQADLTCYESAQAVVEAAVKRFGKVNILVNCAGVTGIGDMEHTTTEEFERQFRINVGGVFHMCKAALPALKMHPGAAIVNLGSDLGVRPIPERISYCPSKAAVIMLTKCIAAEQAPAIRANCINPGLVMTPMVEARLSSPQEKEAFVREMASIYPLQKLGTVDDMAAAALYLASDESGYVTGECIGACGGSLI
ncbi:MAG: SDR family NAD(P)-dependent oxidoreductase [Eubacteriales bacterium]|nr:SDR family NAD(P)-dependent oxidoreductase [Eubacteriales bacterium]